MGVQFRPVCSKKDGSVEDGREKYIGSILTPDKVNPYFFLIWSTVPAFWSTWGSSFTGAFSFLTFVCLNLPVDWYFYQKLKTFCFLLSLYSRFQNLCSTLEGALHEFKRKPCFYIMDMAMVKKYLCFFDVITSTNSKSCILQDTTKK